MIENLLDLACENALATQCLLLFGILLAGLNVPVSLDLMLLSAGALTSVCPSVSPVVFFLFVGLTAWVSAWEAYWLGRLLGPRLYRIRWFNHVLPQHRVEKLHSYYERFGFLTFIVGRFIPGGVRNALFMTSGLGRMPFLTFILRDLPACFLSCGLIFSLGHLFADHYKTIVHYFVVYNRIVILAIFVLGVSLFLLAFLRKSNKR